MSSQFSYELDERQIRILMQNVELEFDSTAWDRFEQTAQPEVKSHLNSFSPKINFAISRSVIVPVIFIALIGGLSAMLFSFVDFKKKDPPKEAALLPSTDKAKDITLSKTETVTKKEAVAPAPEENHVTIASTPSVSAKLVIKEPAKEIKSSLPLASKAITEKPVEKKTVIVQEKKTAVIPVKRKRKKVAAEEMPILQTSSSINLNAGTEERELELK